MNQVSSLYVHFPYCIHLCNYCDFYKHKFEKADQVTNYQELLREQMEAHLSLLKKNNYELINLTSLYIGGGTPSLWKPAGIKFLLELLKENHITLEKSCEFTIEIDPGTFDEKDLGQWLDLGVNRFSLGVQAFSEKHLEILDRKHSIQEVKNALEQLRGTNFSVDLMIGTPHAEGRDLTRELQGLLSYQPSHLSVYILSTRKNYPLNQSLPSDSKVREDYLFVSRFLEEMGYEHYEVSNFAKQGARSKHNKKYWSYSPVAALGPNATGLLVFENSALRYQWKSLSAGFIEEKLVDESLQIEQLFLGLRARQDFDLESRFSVNQRADLEELFNLWQRRGYLQDGSSLKCLNLSALGFLMSDSMLDELFRISP